jgi:hypothetical protein
MLVSRFTPVTVADDARRDAPGQEVRGQHRAGGTGDDRQYLAAEVS